MLLRRRHDPAPILPSALTDASVVVVDDNPFIHMAVSRALPTARITEAWRIHELRDAVATQTPTAVVVASRLPDASGLEAVAAMRSSAALADVVLVVLTRPGVEWECVEAMAIGADAHVAKDGDLDQLGSILEELLTMSPDERAERRRELAGTSLALAGS